MALNILNKFCAPRPNPDSTDDLNITAAAKVAFAGSFNQVNSCVTIEVTETPSSTQSLLVLTLPSVTTMRTSIYGSNGAKQMPSATTWPSCSQPQAIKTAQYRPFTYSSYGTLKRSGLSCPNSKATPSVTQWLSHHPSRPPRAPDPRYRLLNRVLLYEMYYSTHLGHGLLELDI
jgi:hypothetical protein